MTKEEALELLKHLVLQLRDHSKELQANPDLMKDWVAKSNHCQNSIKSLNSLDTVWVDREYKEWFKKEIQPKIPK